VTLRRGMSMLGLRGFKKEDLLEMDYIFYKDLLSELAILTNFGAVSHILSNPYAEKSSELVERANPFNIDLDDLKDTGKPKATLSVMKQFGLITDQEIQNS